jgi:NAD(P)H-nitrite reductase large subunit
MDTQTIEADLIILATGVQAERLLPRRHRRTDRPGHRGRRASCAPPCRIYAAGDVAQGRDFSTGEWVVHALQPTATEHGRIAGHQHGRQDHALPRQPEHERARHGGLISHTFGEWQGREGGEMVELTDEPRFLYTRLCFHDDRMIGAITVGNPNHVGAIRGLIQGRRRLGRWKDELLSNPHQVMAAFVDLTQNPAVDS